MVNEKLAKKQGLTEDDILVIERLHTKREELEEQLKSCKPVEIQKLFYLWTENEFELQRVWKFPLDEKYHRSWYLPHCICAKIDNDERYGYGMYVTKGCPIHNPIEEN